MTKNRPIGANLVYDALPTSATHLIGREIERGYVNKGYRGHNETQAAA